MPQPQVWGKEYLLAPYLTLKDDGTTYTMSGTIDMNVFSKLFSDPDTNWSGIKSYQYVFKVDKATNRLVSEAWTRTITADETPWTNTSYTWQIDLQKFNQVPTIQTPDSVLKAVQN